MFDTIWKEGGLDLRIKRYECLPISANEGLIEIVQDAETIFNVQMEVKLGDLRSESLQSYRTDHTVEPYYWAMDIGTANLKKEKYSLRASTAILMVYLES